jgi:hypothetical protein
VKAELKQKWIDALRSGNYPQGQGCLKSPNLEYCCLGVLCDVLGLEWVYDQNRSSYGVKGDHVSLVFNNLPFSLRQKLMLSENHANQLIDMNDTWGNRFNHIADWIEANIPVTE